VELCQVNKQIAQLVKAFEIITVKNESVVVDSPATVSGMEESHMVVITSTKGTP
jgi:hypothetical protein